jgi:hypothetical protein
MMLHLKFISSKDYWIRFINLILSRIFPLTLGFEAETVGSNTNSLYLFYFTSKHFKIIKSIPTLIGSYLPFYISKTLRIMEHQLYTTRDSYLLRVSYSSFDGVYKVYHLIISQFVLLFHSFYKRAERLFSFHSFY